MKIFIDVSLFVLLVITCPVLSALENGTISCSPGNDSPGDTCTLTCDDGFEISGTQSRTCQDDGTWNGADDTVCTSELHDQQIAKPIQYKATNMHINTKIIIGDHHTYTYACTHAHTHVSKAKEKQSLRQPCET